jgi:hypothetical protein
VGQGVNETRSSIEEVQNNRACVWEGHSCMLMAVVVAPRALQFATYVENNVLLNNYAHVFDLLIRLRQAVDHPYLVVYSATGGQGRWGRRGSKRRSRQAGRQAHVCVGMACVMERGSTACLCWVCAQLIVMSSSVLCLMQLARLQSCWRAHLPPQVPHPRGCGAVQVREGW